MNAGYNVFLLTAATALVGLGSATIQTNLLAGVIEIVLGIVAFLVYEKTPMSK